MFGGWVFWSCWIFHCICSFQCVLTWAGRSRHSCAISILLWTWRSNSCRSCGCRTRRCTGDTNWCVGSTNCLGSANIGWSNRRCGISDCRLRCIQRVSFRLDIHQHPHCGQILVPIINCSQSRVCIYGHKAQDFQVKQRKMYRFSQIKCVWWNFGPFFVAERTMSENSRMKAMFSHKATILTIWWGIGGHRCAVFSLLFWLTCCGSVACPKQASSVAWKIKTARRSAD